MTSEIAFSGVGAKPQGWDAYVAGCSRLFWDPIPTNNTNQIESILIGIVYFVFGRVTYITVLYQCFKRFSFMVWIFVVLRSRYYTKHIYIITKSYYRGVISLNICQRGLGATERGHRFMESTKQGKCSGIPMVQKKV